MDCHEEYCGGTLLFVAAIKRVPETAVNPTPHKQKWYFRPVDDTDEQRLEFLKYEKVYDGELLHPVLKEEKDKRVPLEVRSFLAEEGYDVV